MNNKYLHNQLTKWSSLHPNPDIINSVLRTCQNDLKEKLCVKHSECALAGNNCIVLEQKTQFCGCWVSMGFDHENFTFCIIRNIF